MKEAISPMLCALLILGLGSLPAGAQTLTVLYTFSGGSDGAFPHGTLLRDAQGNFYGVTINGGSAGLGTVYKLDSSGNETILYSFTGTPDGRDPISGLLLDGRNFYGITENGGTRDVGTAYKINLQGKERVIHTFGLTAKDGKYPAAELIRDSSGNLYSAAQNGGSFGSGIVFKLTTSGTETILHTFNKNAGDGFYPLGGLVLDNSGNLYGTTFDGGKTGLSGSGTIFKIDSAGQETLLYNFGQNSSDGVHPEGSLIRDTSGNLYGVTAFGGTANLGTVFEVDSTGNETILHTFTGGSDGANPAAGLVRDSAGNLYGTTDMGGSYNFGTVFEIDTTGKETILYTFTGQADGAYPESSLIQDATGTLYGTTNGSANGTGAQYGTVFKLVP